MSPRTASRRAWVWWARNLWSPEIWAALRENRRKSAALKKKIDRFEAALKKKTDCGVQPNSRPRGD